jgi:hypothetical protein
MTRELTVLRTRVAATAMHPFDRRALERQLRARELAQQRELESALARPRS